MIKVLIAPIDPQIQTTDYIDALMLVETSFRAFNPRTSKVFLLPQRPKGHFDRTPKYYLKSCLYAPNGLLVRY